MASARIKMMMTVWCVVMVMSYMVLGVLGTPFDCMNDCTKSCGLGFFCHVKCEFKCIKFTGAGFFHLVNSKKVVKHNRGSSASLLPLPSPPCQSKGLEKKIKSAIN
ncbi:hypothetical protein ES332_A11G296400v1 [Gossypium tomentosum]|uniref:Uncharacterized protein n=1 Tax=Gossypium tomentosum TaxID=34277 RepID=A0A5D2NI38_GOSTO|nr:hypothetical protein ES332_A11G296400v1 [Gossypium tomentosum]